MVNVGWLGLGAMGLPMARRLLGTVADLAGFDPVERQVKALVAAGARAAATPAAAADGADVLIVMAATPEQVSEALFGHQGAAAALVAGSTVVVMSTIGPAAVRGLGERLEAGGLGLLDAPVTGGVARAERGELVVMASGPRERFETLRYLLERLGSSVVHVGASIGDGQSVKLVNQLLCGVHIAAAGEALGLAAALGLEPRAVWEVVRQGAAGSFMLDERGERMLEGTFEPVRSALDIFVKDMGLVVAAARRSSYPAPLAATAEQLYLLGAAEGLGRRDDATLVTLYERWAGRPVTARQHRSTADSPSEETPAGGAGR